MMRLFDDGFLVPHYQEIETGKIYLSSEQLGILFHVKKSTTKPHIYRSPDKIWMQDSYIGITGVQVITIRNPFFVVPLERAIEIGEHFYKFHNTRGKKYPKHKRAAGATLKNIVRLEELLGL